jgi:hypothetical protein
MVAALLYLDLRCLYHEGGEAEGFQLFTLTPEP